MASSNRILSLRLINALTRPMILYCSNGIEVTTLFDTGASTPVWCMGETKLMAAYPDATKIDAKCEVSGFGRIASECDIFKIPQFILSDSNGKYIIRNLHIAETVNPAIGCDFVMSDTMFAKADTTVVRRGERQLVISCDREEYYCTPKIYNHHFGISVWSQETEVI